MLSPTRSSQRTMWSTMAKLAVALACTNRPRWSTSGLASLKYTNLVDEYSNLQEVEEEHLLKHPLISQAMTAWT